MISKAGKLFYVMPVIAVLVASAVLVKPESLPADAVAMEPVLIIDAGHGGADGGAVAPDGTPEADINLDIALRVEALADFCGTPAIMTRQGADIDYPVDAQTLAQMKVADQRARLALINETTGAIMVSIHQNFFSSSSPCGAQVFYGEKAGSDTLAAQIQSNLTAQLQPQNRRMATRISEDIYLMKNAACRAVLVECGFLSNADELAKLKTQPYRMQLAAVIFGSYLQYIRGVVT